MKSRVYRFSLILLAILVGLIAVQCAQPGDPAEKTAPTEEIVPTVEIVVPTPASSVPLTYVSFWDFAPSQTLTGSWLSDSRRRIPISKSIANCWIGHGTII